MTVVKKPVKRETFGGIFDRGKCRPVIVSIEPPNLVGLRLKGMKRTYYLTAESIFMQALKASLVSEKKEKGKNKRSKMKRGLL